MFIFVDRILHPALIYGELSWFHLCLFVCGKEENVISHLIKIGHGGSFAAMLAPVLYAKIGGGRNRGIPIVRGHMVVGYWWMAAGG